MAASDPGEVELSDEQRRAIYLALMDEQELHEFTPAQARQLIASRYQLSEDQLRRIEQEGRDRLW